MKFLTLVRMNLSFLQPFSDSSAAFGSHMDTLLMLQLERNFSQQVCNNYITGRKKIDKAK